MPEANYVQDLEDAIRFMCTEMPVGWVEMAIAEGRKKVVDTVCWAVDREGDYPAHIDGSPGSAGGPSPTGSGGTP